MISTGDLSQLLILLNILGVPTGSGGGGGAVTKEQVQEFAFNFAPVTGMDDAFVVDLDPPITSYTDNLIVSLSSGTFKNNTTSPTLQVNGLGAVPITLWAGISVAPGDIMTNSSYLLIYNEVTSSFQLLNPSISTANTFSVQENFYNTAFDSGAVNAYALTLTPAPQGSFSEGFPIYMRVASGHTNTGDSTLTVNGTTDTIYLQNGSQIPAGSMLGNGSYWLLWSSNVNGWVLMNPVPLQTIVTLADESATLPDSFSLGSLTSGLLKIVVTADVAAPATAVNGTDYWAPGDVIVLPGAPTTSLDAATKGYVDSIAAGLNPTEAVQGASVANLTGYTYSPGAAGVGATLTAGSSGAFIQDGVTYTVGQRFLYKNDTTGSGAYNGIYDVTTVGDGSTPAVLTRSANYNTPEAINGSGLIPVIAGTVNAGTGWLNTSTVVTVGVTPIVYVQFGQTAGVISPVNGGTGISNAPGSTITLDGALVFDGAYTFDQTVDTASSPEFVDLTLSGGQLIGSLGNPVVTISDTASAVNWFNFKNSVVDSLLLMQAVGTSTAIPIYLQTLGDAGLTILAETTTAFPFTIINGSTGGHVNNFAFSNTSETRTITFSDGDGTVAFISDIPSAITTIDGDSGSATPTAGVLRYREVLRVINRR